MRYKDTPLCAAICNAVVARANCAKSGNSEWFDRWSEQLEQLAQLLPSGSGFDSGTRIDIEQDIVTRVVEELLRAGYELRTSADDEDGKRPSYTTDRAAILAALIEVDDEYLIARKHGRRSWVWFVYGNDGPDVISDYTTDLELVLHCVNSYADSLG